MMNRNIIILIAVLAVALGFLAFSVYFYMSRQGTVEMVETPIVGERATTPTADVSYTDSWAQVFGEARVAMDPQVCSQLATSAEVRDCADKINLLIAYRDQSLNKCRAIFNAQLRDSCFINLGNALNADYCKHLSTQEAQQACQEEFLAQ